LNSHVNQGIANTASGVGQNVVAGFPPDFLDAAAKQKEVTLTTYGRKTGKPIAVTIWISTDGQRLFIRSGGGMSRNWPQNLEARGEAVLELGGRSVNVRPRQVTDPTEARAASQLARNKYGSYVKPSKPTEPLTKGEQATFELLPAD
jgi:deazaflavin-dependent oxidoreductase (nitroreductase family)